MDFFKRRIVPLKPNDKKDLTEEILEIKKDKIEEVKSKEKVKKLKNDDYGISII